MATIHKLYPNATVGFGELGLPKPVTSATLASAQAIVDYYYRLGNLDLSYYVGGYYWWYAGDDIVQKQTAVRHDRACDDLATTRRFWVQRRDSALRVGVVECEASTARA